MSNTSRFAVRLLGLALLPLLASCYTADVFVNNGTIQFSIAASSVAEGGGTVVVTVQRSGSADGDVSVTFTTNDGTATAGADYVAGTGSLSWASGDMSDRNVPITINQDLLVEGSESFTVTLSVPTGGAELGAIDTNTVSITDDDSPNGALQFTLATDSINESAGTITVFVSRTGGTTGAVSVDYATADGTATAPGEYTTSSGTLNWGNTVGGNQSFTVPIVADFNVEGNQTFSIALSNATGGATIGSPVATVITILDDDTPGTLQFTVSSVSIGESAGTVGITISRTGGVGGTVSVDVATAVGTATGADFTAIPTTTHTWVGGDGVSQSFNVTIAPDFLVEGDESFTVNLSNVVSATLGANTTNTVTITDDDTPGVLQFSASSVAVNENVAGGIITISVTRTGGSGGAATVNFTTTNGTAASGSDYVATSGMLSWAAGDAAPKTFNVTITDDLANEGDETFTVDLSGVTGDSLGAITSETVTITDNDIFGSLQFSSATYSATETTGGIPTVATITVQRVGGSSGAVSVNFATSNGTANGADYTAANGTLNWANGDTADKTFTVTLKNNDAQPEGNETFNLTLSAPTGGAVLGTPSTAVFTIIND